MDQHLGLRRIGGGTVLAAWFTFQLFSGIEDNRPWWRLSLAVLCILAALGLVVNGCLIWRREAKTPQQSDDTEVAADQTNTRTTE